MTKSAHFLPVRTKFLAEDYMRLYLHEIRKMHGVPISINPDCGRRLWTKNVASVKVLWQNHKVEEATWEAKEDIKSKYPHLFSAPNFHAEVLGLLWTIFLSRGSIGSNLYTSEVEVSVLSIPRKKPPKLDDGRSNNCLEAMRSSSPPRKKILKEVNIDVSSDDANVAYLSWMVYELVGLPELYYAGSHGMDIMLPVENTLATNDANCIKATDQQGKEVNLFQLARKFLSMIDEVFRTLVKKTKDIKVQKLRTISFVPLCITNWSAFGEYVVDVLKGYPRLRLTHGRKGKVEEERAIECFVGSTCLQRNNKNDIVPPYGQTWKIHSLSYYG
ncbi:putative trehalose-phosphate phosphatase G [Capsicum annuum]|uniref:Trehalose-phosphate phosphatase G n=1 Tax=Capsicum annuum TaxID=4072 RepID=A0A2G2YK19_CAPAN|nr:putative trehalose-phosphate phosphatase G [Capsicum annuum]PHT70084.1 putative trehalose-phosphate phosphatase G [Capsicum annuum]